MPIDANTLQRIAQGGTLPQNTLAGQIADRRRAAQKQQYEMKIGLEEQMRKAAQTDSEIKRRAYLTAKEKADAQRMKLLGLSEKLLIEAQANPQAIQQQLSRAPGVARALAVDPNSPDFLNQLKATRNQLYTQTQGKIYDKSSDQQEYSQFVRADSDLGEYLGLDRNQEVKYVGPALSVENLEAGKARTTGFEYTGPQQEAGPTAYQEDIAGIRAKGVERAVEASQDAPVRLDRIQSMKSAIEGGAATGFAGETRQGIAQAMELFGLDPEKVAPGILSSGASTEIIDSASNQLAVELMNAQEGRISRLELKTIKNALPELTKTQEGNMILLDILERKALRDQNIGTIANIFANTPAGLLTSETKIPGVGELPKGTSLSQAVSKYDAQNPIVDEDMMKRIKEAGTEPQTPPKDAEGNVVFSKMREGQSYRINGKDYVFRGYDEDAGDYVLEEE